MGAGWIVGGKSLEKRKREEGGGGIRRLRDMEEKGRRRKKKGNWSVKNKEEVILLTCPPWPGGPLGSPRPKGSLLGLVLVGFGPLSQGRVD
jgi:hypothetical protein